MCCSNVHEAEAKFLFENNMADWLAAYVLPYNSKMLDDVMLYAERIGASRGSMVANRDGRITVHINQSHSSSHYKEGMAQYLWNLEVFLVTVLDVDGMGIVRQNVE